VNELLQSVYNIIAKNIANTASVFYD